MSQQPVVYVSQPSNSLGLAGFIISLAGLVVSCGLLCPVGMVLSFFAMFRRPRGFAVAGFILGLIGSLWLVVALAFGLFAMLLAAVGIASASGPAYY